MEYTAEYIDVEKFERGLRDHREYQKQQQMLAVEKARAFYDGYEKCILDTTDMFHCSNYESSVKSTTAFHKGVDAAMLAICKELSIPLPVGLGSDASFEQKMAAFAEHIRTAQPVEPGISLDNVREIDPAAFAGCERKANG